jgi:hypothetical protein
VAEFGFVVEPSFVDACLAFVVGVSACLAIGMAVHTRLILSQILGIYTCLTLGLRFTHHTRVFTFLALSR